MLKPPCLVCDSRYFGCHGSCTKYREFQKQNKELNDKRRKAMDQETDIIKVRGKR